MPRKTFFLYDVGGYKQSVASSVTIVISEKELPKRIHGVCAHELPGLSKAMKEGTVLDLIIGDPRIVKGTTLIEKNSKSMPKEFRKDVEGTFWCFRLPKSLGGGRMWVDWYHVAKVPKQKTNKSDCGCEGSCPACRVG